MTNRYFLLCFCIAESILLIGCGETEDDRREELFLNNFSKAIENKDNCAAHRIATGRFAYILAEDESQRKINKRINEWQDRINESTIACKKSIWEKFKVNIEEEQKVLNKFLSLKNITATYIGDSLRSDKLNRNCEVDLYILNPSEFQVINLAGNWEKQRRYREHFEYKSQKYKIVGKNAELFNQPIKVPIGLDPILPGNSKKIPECNLKVAEEIQRNGGINININIQEVGIVLDGEVKSFSLAEIDNKIAKIKNILETGYEAINLPNPEDYSVLTR